MMSEVVGRKARILIGLGNIDRAPLFFGIELHPTVITVYSSIIAFRRDCRAYSKAGWDANSPCQRYKVSVKVSAVSCADIACINSVPLTPARAVFHVAHAVDDVIVNGTGSHKVALLAFDNCLGYVFKILINWDEAVWLKTFFPIIGLRTVCGFFNAFYPIMDIDSLCAVFRPELKEKNLITVFGFL